MNLIKRFIGDKLSTDNNIMLDELDNFFLPHHHQTKATSKTSFHEDFAISDTVDIKVFNGKLDGSHFVRLSKFDLQHLQKP
jgi:hypothetical protein